MILIKVQTEVGPLYKPIEDEDEAYREIGAYEALGWRCSFAAVPKDWGEQDRRVGEGRRIRNE